MIPGTAKRSRRLLSSFGPFLWWALLGVWDPAVGQSEGEGGADRVIQHATVMTMDAAQPRAEALAIRGERIVAVGSDAEIGKWIGPGTEVIDARGRLVVPGFNDSHCHFESGCRSLQSLNLYGVNRLEKVLELVAAKAAETPRNGWVLGARYDHTLWGRDWPTREHLDRVAPDHPVMLTRASGHSVWVNSRALAISGITAATKDPPAGEIQRDSKGEPTGILLENAVDLLKLPPPAGTPEELRAEHRKNLLIGLKHAARLGVTTVQTSSSVLEMEILRELQQEGLLTLRFTGWLELDLVRQLASKGHLTGQGDLWVRTGFLKGYIDGTLGDGTAALFEPFADRPDSTGLPTMTQEKLNDLVLFADRSGFQVGVHAIGDRGVRMVLDAFDLCAARNGRRDVRHRIEHAQLIHPDDVRRFGALGVIASMQQTHCTTDQRFAEPRVGFERCKTAYAWRSLIDSGAMLAFGTDWPVEPLDPMRGVFSSVTRTNIETMQPQSGWFPEQKLTVWESLYYYTHGSACSEHLEDVKGSLRPGKLADLVIVDRDLFGIPPAEILQAKVDLTIVGGSVVYTR